MNLLPDISERINLLFPASDREQAAALVSGATIHDGSAAEPRYQRCAVQASNGSLERLAYYTGLLKIDYRDVVVAGEYEHRNGNLVRVRSLIGPFEAIAQDNPARPDTTDK